MEFFGRKAEIKELQDIRNRSFKASCFTIVTGRRRIGKTSLLLRAYSDVDDLLYFFVARKTEGELCRDFVDEITSKLDTPILGNPAHFSEIFNYLMQLSKTRPLTLIIDEFQDFRRVNSSIYSEMQKIWDLNKQDAHFNLVVCGSVYSLMNVIFKNSKEPLYGRQTGELRVEPFMTMEIKEILANYNPEYTPDDLLALYSYTGGVAEYVEVLMDDGAADRKSMEDKIIKKNSYFIYEGRNMLIEEFGKDYDRYFEIMALIASGKTTRQEIEDTMKMEVSGYLTRLERDYNLVSRHMPLFHKTNRNIHYQIEDNFLRFWFRYFYRYSFMVEANGFRKLREVIDNDYTTYTGRVLEKYFKAVLAESEDYTRIDSWWDRKGENEIDIIAADELQKKVTFYEVKRQTKDISIGVLKDKAEKFFEATGKFSNFDIEYKGLSLDDM